MSGDRKIALNKMAAICSRREYCESDIREKLARYHLDSEDEESVLTELKIEKYLDNRRYSIAYVRDKSVIAGWGRKKIEFALRRKGISSEDIEAACMELDDDNAYARMEEIISRKWRQLEGEEDMHVRRIKTLRYALGRGYSYDQVDGVIKQLTKRK